MPADVDKRRYEYKGYFGCESHCRLRLFRDRRNGDTVAVVTELDTNEGTSVTNMAEGLAAQIIAEFGIEPSAYVHIEHYPATRDRFGNIEFEETFSQVAFTYTFTGPNGQEQVKPNSAIFNPLTATEVASLTRTPVSEWADEDGNTESDRTQIRRVRNAERELRRREIVSRYRQALDAGDIEGTAWALSAAYAVSADDPEIDEAIRAGNRELAEAEGIPPVEGAEAVVKEALARVGEPGALTLPDSEAGANDCPRHGIFLDDYCPGCSFEARVPEAAGQFDAWLASVRRPIQAATTN